MELILFSIVIFLLKFAVFIASLLLIIFVHEMGHYLVGRWCGIGASAFSLGFGRELVGFTDKRGTRWKLCLIPLGGYVKFIGDEDPTSMPSVSGKELPKNAFFAASAWRRALTVFAGPLSNGVFAIVIFTIFFMSFGRYDIEPVAGQVLPNSPAAQAGIMSGDKIISLDGNPVYFFSEVQNYITLRSGDEVEVGIERNGNFETVIVTPERVSEKNFLGREAQTGRIGIVVPLDPNEPNRIDPQYIKRMTYGLLDSVGEAYKQSKLIVTQTFRFIGRLFVGREDVNQLSGPIATGQAAFIFMDMGVIQYINLLAFLSLSIGLINLFPLPPLDGGHLVFYLIETFTGRKVPDRIQFLIFKIGFFVVIAFMIFVTFNDIGVFSW